LFSPPYPLSSLIRRCSGPSVRCFLVVVHHNVVDCCLSSVCSERLGFKKHLRHSRHPRHLHSFFCPSDQKLGNTSRVLVHIRHKVFAPSCSLVASLELSVLTTGSSMSSLAEARYRSTAGSPACIPHDHEGSDNMFVDEELEGWCPSSTPCLSSSCQYRAKSSQK